METKMERCGQKPKVTRWVALGIDSKGYPLSFPGKVLLGNGTHLVSRTVGEQALF